MMPTQIVEMAGEVSGPVVELPDDSNHDNSSSMPRRLTKSIPLTRFLLSDVCNSKILNDDDYDNNKRSSRRRGINTLRSHFPTWQLLLFVILAIILGIIVTSKSKDKMKPLITTNGTTIQTGMLIFVTLVVISFIIASTTVA